MTPHDSAKTEEKLLELAKILLEEDFAEFQTLREELIADPARFLEAGHGDRFNLSEEDLDPGESPFISADKLALDPDRTLDNSLLFLLHFAETYRYSFWLDWKGEENEGSFELWVAARANAFGKGSMDLTFVDEWQEAIDFTRLESGEFIRNKFTLLGQHLVSIGLDLIFLSTGEDAYHPFVVRGEDLERLPQFSEADSKALGWFYVKRWDDHSL